MDSSRHRFIGKAYLFSGVLVVSTLAPCINSFSLPPVLDSRSKIGVSSRQVSLGLRDSAYFSGNRATVWPRNLRTAFRPSKSLSALHSKSPREQEEQDEKQSKSESTLAFQTDENDNDVSKILSNPKLRKVLYKLESKVQKLQDKMSLDKVAEHEKVLSSLSSLVEIVC
jgi:hypothetical protein